MKEFLLNLQQRFADDRVVEEVTTKLINLFRSFPEGKNIRRGKILTRAMLKKIVTANRHSLEKIKQWLAA